MAVAFRNTISSVFASLFSHLRGLEGTSGDNSSITIRKVAEGEAMIGAHPVASVVLQLLDAKIVGRSDSDKQWRQQLKIRIETEVQSADAATSEILSKIAQVEDRIESFAKPEGVAGLEDAEWSITFGASAEHGNTLTADSRRVFTVMVTRGAN